MNNMTNIMLDLETLGKDSNAVILSIGAVFFDPLTGETGAEFYQTVDLNDSLKYGKVDASTITWWMKQGYDAKDIFEDELASLLSETLLDFYTFVNLDLPAEKEGSAVVWGNGPSFDNVILRNAYEACYEKTGLEAPWEYFNEGCVRTVVRLGKLLLNIDPKNTMTFSGTTHNALDDAKHQVKYVSDIISKLDIPLNPRKYLPAEFSNIASKSPSQAICAISEVNTHG